MEQNISLENRFKKLSAQILHVAKNVGRESDEIKILAVSKGQRVEDIQNAFSLGQTDFGENKVQEGIWKKENCPSNICWHLIGPLQKNKIKHAAKYFDVFHAVDRIEIAEKLNLRLQEEGRHCPMLIEINVGEEKTKHGFLADNIKIYAEGLAGLSNLDWIGLMTIPPFTKNPDDSRSSFAKLRSVRDSLEKEVGLSLPELSMGMSHDFTAAIAEGATWLRLGTILFGPRKSWQEIKES